MARMVDIPNIIIQGTIGTATRVSLLQKPAESQNVTLPPFAVLIFFPFALIGNCTAVAASPWVILIAVLVSNLAARLASSRVKWSVTNTRKGHNLGNDPPVLSSLLESWIQVCPYDPLI